jgi:predicted site-specific integrase-resolvase
MAGVKQVAVTSARSGSDEADNTFLRKTGLVECPYDKSQKRAYRESEVKRIMELKAGNKNVAYGLK